MDQLDFVTIGAKLGVEFVPFLFALCFHEFAHGWVAKQLGDNTAERVGRLNLNPFSHADPIGTWLLPIVAILGNSQYFFGWAKPVPVDSRNLKRPLQDMFWIALAGPVSNLLLAFVAALGGIIVARATGQTSIYYQLLSSFVLINCALAVFNLIPVHPLDGGKVIARFIPARWNIWLERNEMMLSMGLLLFFLTFRRILSFPILLVAMAVYSAAGWIVSGIA